MKTVLKIVFLLVFVFATSLFLLLLSLRLSGLSASSLKTQLLTSAVYSKLVTALDREIDRAIKEGEADDPLRLVGPILKQEVTPQYLQTKVEALLDDTSAWLSGRTNEPPAISLKDLKEKFRRQNPQLFVELEALGKELNAQKKTLEQQPDVDIEKLIKSDFTFPLGKQLTWLKWWYDMATTRLLLVAAALVGFLLALVFLNDSKQSKFRWAGAALGLASLWNILFWLVAVGISRLVPIVLAQAAGELPSFVSPLIMAFLQPLVTSYLQVAPVAILGLLVSSVGCFVMSRRR